MVLINLSFRIKIFLFWKFYRRLVAILKYIRSNTPYILYANGSSKSILSNRANGKAKIMLRAELLSFKKIIFCKKKKNIWKSFRRSLAMLEHIGKSIACRSYENSSLESPLSNCGNRIVETILRRMKLNLEKIDFWSHLSQSIIPYILALLTPIIMDMNEDYISHH